MVLAFWWDFTNCKQVRYNIVLAVTLVCSLVIYLIYLICLGSQHFDLINIGGTRYCWAIKIIFGNQTWTNYTNLNINFGVNRTFHMPKTPVSWFNLYGSYPTLRTDQDNFQYSHLKFAQDYSISIWSRIKKVFCKHIDS